MKKQIIIGEPLGSSTVPINIMRPDAEIEGRIPLRHIRKDIVCGVDANIYMFGECSVIVTREFGKWHLSIAHPSRYPTWPEISQAWYRIVPGAGKDVVGALILPKIDEYVNVHKFCMQILEIDGEKEKI